MHESNEEPPKQNANVDAPKIHEKSAANEEDV